MARANDWTGGIRQCKACGAEFKSFWQFCPKCGERAGVDLLVLVDLFRIGARVAIWLLVFYFSGKISENLSGIVFIVGVLWIYTAIFASYKRWRIRKNPVKAFREEHPDRLYPETRTSAAPARHDPVRLPPETVAPATPPSPLREADIAGLKAENQDIMAKQAARDAKLLEIIRKLARTDRKGTLAVNVHQYFDACGISDDTTRQVIESAISRNIITRAAEASGDEVYFEGSASAKK
jgi:hypothetical protein